MMDEKSVLKKLGIQDFRHLTKKKAVKLVNMLGQVDPEVAKKALEQYPELTKTALEMANGYKETLEKMLDKNELSSKAALDAVNTIIDVLSKELGRDELGDEERRYLVDQLVSMAHLAREIDQDNKDFFIKIAEIGGVVLVGVLALAAVVLDVGAQIADDDESEDL